jgi:hypothetical protein
MLVVRTLSGTSLLTQKERIRMNKIMVLLVLLLCACAPPTRAQYYDRDGNRWTDLNHAELMNAVIETQESLKNQKSQRIQLEAEYQTKTDELNKVISDYNNSCQTVVKSLNDHQLKLYSSLLEAEKSKNLPQIELSRRQFYKSLSNKNIQDLSSLDDPLKEINTRAEDLKRYSKELEASKERVIEASQKADRAAQRAIQYSDRSYSAQVNRNQDEILNYLKEWEKENRQRNILYNNNYELMRMNSSLSSIAVSLNRMSIP